MGIYFSQLKKNFSKNNGIHFTQSGHLKVQQMDENILETITQDFHAKTKQNKNTGL